MQKDKVYVQHKILEQKQLVWKLLENGAVVYICGGMQMGKSVINSIQEIAKENNANDSYIQQLRNSHRIIEELWS